MKTKIIKYPSTSGDEQYIGFKVEVDDDSEILFGGYLSKLEDIYEKSFRICRSMDGVCLGSSQDVVAWKIFSSFKSRILSILSLVPFSSYNPRSQFHWDSASIATLVRSMIESRLSLHHLGVQNSNDPDEWNFRFQILMLHAMSTTNKLEKMEIGNSGSNARDAEINEFRDKIISHRLFSTLSTSQANKVRDKNSSYKFSLENMAENANLGKGLYNWLYKILSQSSHALPLSITNGLNVGKGVITKDEVKEITNCLRVAVLLAQESLGEMLEKIIEYGYVTHASDIFNGVGQDD